MSDSSISLVSYTHLATPPDILGNNRRGVYSTGKKPCGVLLTYMTILSIDSGIEKTGFAIFNKKKISLASSIYITSGLIKTSAKFPTEKRLLKLYQEVSDILTLYKPRIIIIEQIFFFKNQKTVIKVSQAQGVILLLAGQKNIPVEFLTPLQIKQIVTGYGQADKKSVQKMLSLTLGLKKELTQDDTADAIACGLAYCLLNKNLL